MTFESVVYLRFMYVDRVIKETQTEYNPTTVIPGGRGDVRRGPRDTEVVGRN
jgi:hypothetical protein